MPRIKVDKDELDVAALEEAEWTESEFDTYEGNIPPKGTILNAYVKTMWWSHTQAGDGMLKILIIADENEGELKEYDGLTIWENLALSPGAKFKWKPFIDHFGITLRDIQTKMVAKGAEDHPTFGAELSKVGTFEPGSESSWCRVITSRERYDDAWQAHVFKWLDFLTVDEDEEEPEEIEDEELDEELEEEEEEEAEPEPAPARRTRTAKPIARSARTTAKPAARGTRTASTTPRAAKPARRAAKPADDEPPF